LASPVLAMTSLMPAASALPAASWKVLAGAVMVSALAPPSTKLRLAAAVNWKNLAAVVP